MSHWLEKYAEWEGRAEELANLANAILKQLRLPKPGVPLNERLVRNYVQRELLDRPVRRGREAYFGFRQLLQVVGARVLLNRGMGFTDAAKRARHMDQEELLNLFPEEEPAPPPNIEDESRPSGLSDLGSLRLETSSGTVTPERTFKPAKESLERRTTLQFLEGEEWMPQGRSALYVDVVDWLRVYLDEEKFAQQPREALHFLVKAIAAILFAEHQRILEKYSRKKAEES